MLTCLVVSLLATDEKAILPEIGALQFADPDLARRDRANPKSFAVALTVEDEARATAAPPSATTGGRRVQPSAVLRGFCSARPAGASGGATSTWKFRSSCGKTTGADARSRSRVARKRCGNSRRAAA